MAKRKGGDDYDLDEFIKTYSSYLLIDEDALDENIKRQPSLFYDVAERLALCASRRDDAKKRLSELEADLDEEVRRAAKKKKDKITEREIASEIRRSPDFQEAGDECLRWTRAVGRLGALKEAFEQRRYMLREMAGTFAAGYWGNAVARTSRDTMREREAEIAREEMTRARRGRARA